MIIRDGIFINFGSFERLEFTYNEMGLCLISGPTGVGKSTLMDAVSWCLFGVTSKDGAVDDVRRWGTKDITSGFLNIDVPGHKLEVHRIRHGGKGNDLWLIDNGGQKRGKDMVETQKIIEQALGVSSELFFTASYFTQFSAADKFFIASAKDRRTTLDSIVDLRLPSTLSSSVSERRKEANRTLDSCRLQYERQSASIAEQRRGLDRLRDSDSKWTESHAKRLSDLRRDADEFDKKTAEKIKEIEAKIASIGEVSLKDITSKIKKLEIEKAQRELLRPKQKQAQQTVAKLDAEIESRRREHKKFSAPALEICPHCLGPSKNENKAKHLEKLAEELNDLSVVRMEEAAKLEALDGELSNISSLSQQITTAQQYMKTLESRLQEKILLQHELIGVPRINLPEQAFEAAKREVNPHKESLAEATNDLQQAETQLMKAEIDVKFAELDLLSLNQLYDFSNILRGRLLEKSISDLESATNDILEKHFDNEIRVSFEIAGDKVEARIHRGDYEAGYKQLSGGQRGILRLAFGKALMDAAANKAGVHFDSLFFDESMTGLSPDFQAKAFGLFQSMATEHSSVFIIEHSPEFAQLVDRQFKVTMENDVSRYDE